MRRICIIGTSSSGKTTLGRETARRLGAVSIDLDDLHWEPNWTEVPDEEFRRRLLEAMTAPSWVISGNYSAVQEIYMAEADTLVWLDFSFPVVMGRALRRTFRRVVFRQMCCNGNYETWRTTFSRDSILLWVLKTYRRRRRQYAPRFAEPERDGMKFVRLRSPREAKAWLESVTPPS